MKLIKTDSYLLLINEEVEIRVNNLFYPMDGKGHITRRSSMYLNVDGCGKIIAYRPLTKEAKELDLFLLPDPFENNNEMGGGVFNEQLWEDYRKPLNRSMSHLEREAFIAGYKAAQQSKGQYSLDDVEKAIEMAREEYTWTNQGRKGSTEWYYSKEQIIESLSTQQLPSEFIPEYEERGTTKFWTTFYSQNEKGVDNPDNFVWDIFKTITNSEGKEEIQGTYVW